MLGYSEAANIKPLPGILKQVILITMRNPQSYPNMTTIKLVDLSPTFYRLPKPLLVHDSMLLLSTLILSSYSIIVVMLGWDSFIYFLGGGIAHGN